MVFHLFMVFVMSLSYFLVFVRAMQVIALSGRFTRQALPSWVATLTSIPVIVIIGYLSAIQLPPERSAAAIALGVMVATLLLVTKRLKARKPNSPQDVR